MNTTVDKSTDRTTNGTINENLKFVDNLDDYQVHHNDTDVRGFSVKTDNGETIGKVEGLLADVSSKLVRYVEVAVDDQIIALSQQSNDSVKDRHVLVPIGLININQKDNTVTVIGVGYNRFGKYPRYNRANGYTTSYEIDTNDYLHGFHEYGPSYKRDLFSTPRYRQNSRLTADFYDSRFYRNP